MNYKKILILGGTGDSAALANIISNNHPEISLITSFAGRTKKPRRTRGQVISGGFGGGKGLIEFINSRKIELVIDATHPFATKISKNAIFACSQTETPRVLLSRPPWVLPTNANFIEVTSLPAVAKVIHRDTRRVFLTTGTKHLDTFESFNNIWFLIRLIEKPQKPIKIKNHKLIINRPPYNFEDERRIFLNYKIDCLISKNSGGDATRSKIMAALDLNIPLILIRQPHPPPGINFHSVDECLNWLNLKF